MLLNKENSPSLPGRACFQPQLGLWRWGRVPAPPAAPAPVPAAAGAPGVSGCSPERLLCAGSSPHWGARAALARAGAPGANIGEEKPDSYKPGPVSLWAQGWAASGHVLLLLLLLLLSARRAPQAAPAPVPCSADCSPGRRRLTRFRRPCPGITAAADARLPVSGTNPAASLPPRPGPVPGEGMKAPSPTGPKPGEHCGAGEREQSGARGCRPILESSAQSGSVGRLGRRCRHKQPFRAQAQLRAGGFV